MGTLKPHEAIEKSDFGAVTDSLLDFWMRVMSKRSTGYLNILFNLISQHKLLNDGKIRETDRVAHQIIFLETMAQAGFQTDTRCRSQPIGYRRAAHHSVTLGIGF